MRRIIMHLDMDAFFASVEQRDDPRLRGCPVIVGSPPGQRGVVSAASYEARKFGVRSAMPSSTAARLCPKGIFVPPRIQEYKAESLQIVSIMQETGAQVETMSIDEAYLDVTHLFPAEPEISVDELLVQSLPLARTIKARIQEKRRLSASIGIASNKFLSKLGSDFQKPNGLTLIPERDKVLFLRPMPVRAIHGVGPATEQELLKAGLKTIGDLQDYQHDLKHLVGSWGEKLKRYAFGEDDRPLELSDEIKSISCEETFDRDTDDRPLLRQCLRDQAARISSKLLKRRLGAYTIQVKVRYGDFTTLTRQMSTEDPFTEARDIYRLACSILARHRLVSRPLRLLGLGVSGLSEGQSKQLLLLPIS